MSTEVWKDVPGFEGLYQASSLGRVRGLPRTVQQQNRWGKPMLRAEAGKVFAVQWDRDGYGRFYSRVLPENAVHRVVAITFLGEPHGARRDYQVNHKNGDTKDNRPENLEWCTNSENHKHAYDVLGRQPNRNGRAVRITGADGAAFVFPSLVKCGEVLRRRATAVGAAIRRGARCAKYEVSYV